MGIEFVPTLAMQQKIYQLPRNQQRFAFYLQTMLDDHMNLKFPLGLMNPMGKEHVEETVQNALTQGFEEKAAEVVAGIKPLFHLLPGEYQFCLVVSDDLHGGWTNRYFTEFNHHFYNDGEWKRHWITTLLWTGQRYSETELVQEMKSDLYRFVHIHTKGNPRTLKDFVECAGSARLFANFPIRRTLSELNAESKLFESMQDADSFPTIVSFLYGDEIAASLGYPAVGMNRCSGFDFALSYMAMRGDPY